MSTVSLVLSALDERGGDNKEGGTCLSRALPASLPARVRCTHVTNSTYEQSSRMVEPSLELAACKPMSVLMVRALCRELVKCMGTARDGGLGVAAPPGHVTANTCVTVITV